MSSSMVKGLNTYVNVKSKYFLFNTFADIKKKKKSVFVLSVWSIE